MLNQVIQIGRLCKEPEVKTTQSGIEVCNFSIAVKRDFKNKQGEYESDFFNCVAYRNTAKFMSQYCYKGQLINCVGRLQNRSWESDNGKRYITEVIANNVYPLEFKKDKNENKPMEQNADISEDDLPF